MRHLYLPLADIGVIYDNADDGRVLIAKKRRLELSKSTILGAGN